MGSGYMENKFMNDKQQINNIIERLEKLEKEVFGSAIKNRSSVLPKNKSNQKIDYSLNERAFVSRYVADKSGPKKFTLMLAYFTKGGVNKNIQFSEIKKHWGKMTAKNLLGKFNRFYSNEAKTRGWIDSKEYGSYCLTNEWKDIL